MNKEKKELLLFYTYLAMAGAAMGALVGPGLVPIVLSPQVGAALVFQLLAEPMIVVEEKLIRNGNPEVVDREILSRFGNGYCGTVLLLFSFSIASIAIGAGIGAVASAIFPGVMLPQALAAAAIGV